MSKKKMHIYKLKRSGEIDKGGRPAIFLNKFANNYLIWAGTTVLRREEEMPLEIKINGKTGYYYKHNLETVNTRDLKKEWIDKISNEVLVLNSEQEQKLISKFSEFTNQKDPYKVIKNLKKTIKNDKSNIKNQQKIIDNLNKKIIRLEQENDNLKNNQAILTSEQKILKSQIQKQNNKEYEQE